ncbi:MAG: hypothetical protein U0R78_16355 [Nocardioidaceae bacterium]
MATRTVYQRETDVRWAWRGVGGWWWLALVVVPLGVAALVVLLGPVSGQLERASDRALQRAEIVGVSVSVEGRKATVTAATGATPTSEDLERARARVADLPGVAEASVGGSAGGATALLFVEVWGLVLAAYALGSAITWLVPGVSLPREEALEAEVGTPARGVFS